MMWTTFIVVVFPLLLLMPLVERRAKLVIAFLLMGCLCTLLSIELSAIVLRYLPVDITEYKACIAPIIEEVLKAIPIVTVALLFKHNKPRLNEIIPCAIAIGFGFALFENVWLVVGPDSDITLANAILRGISTTLLHGVCCYIVATGIYYFDRGRAVFIVIALGLTLISATLHTAFNTLLYSPYYNFALIAPPIIYVCVLISRLAVQTKV